MQQSVSIVSKQLVPCGHYKDVISWKFGNIKRVINNTLQERLQTHYTKIREREK